MNKVKIYATIEIPYHSYETKALNKKAEKYIKQYVKETIRNELIIVPIYAQKDLSGAPIEDCSQKVKSKFSYE